MKSKFLAGVAWWCYWVRQGHKVGEGGLAGIKGVMVSLGNQYVCDAYETASGGVWVTDRDFRAQERGIWSGVLSMYVGISLPRAHRRFKGPLKPLGLY